MEVSIYNTNTARQGVRDSFHFVFDGGESLRRLNEWELQRQYDYGNDPEKPPPKEHGDNYLFLGAFIGIIVGGILGGVLTIFGGLIVFNIIGGLVVGGLVGVVIGSLVRKRVLKKESEREQTRIDRKLHNFP